MNKVNSKNDSFTRLHEDPLLAIRKQEKSVREDIVHNPVKMARIKHRIAEDLARIEAKKNKDKKEKKVHKEHKKSSKYKRDSKTAERIYSRGRSRSRSVSPDTHRCSKRSQSRSASSDSERGRTRHDNRKRQRSRSPTDYRRNGSSGSPDECRRGGQTGGGRENDSKIKREENISSDDPQNRKSYGLVKNGGYNSSQGKSKGSLGPDIELLKKKEAADAESSDWRKKINRDGAKKMSEEEKKKRIAEMERDALFSEAHRKKSTDIARQVLGDNSEAAKGSGPNAQFIKSMRSEVYNNQDLDASSAMEDRMRRNRHYQQSSSDFDKGFMKV